MSDEGFISIVKRRESPFWVSLVCAGGGRQFFQDALGWDYSIDNYRYKGATHQIAEPDAVEMQGWISQDASRDFYRRYLDRCVAASDGLVAVARRVQKEAEGVPDTPAAQFDKFDEFLRHALSLMPFLASLVLIQTRIEGEIKQLVGAQLGVSPDSAAVADYLRRASVPAKEANFVTEARAMRRLADELAHVSTDDLRTDRVAISLIEGHIAQYGWLGTFTFLNDPFSYDAIVERIEIMRADGETEGADDAVARSAAEQAEADQLAVAAEDSELRELLRLLRHYVYWRFQRIDVHFEAEVCTRALQHRLAEIAGLSRAELVMCTYGELQAWAGGEPLPPMAELRERLAYGIDYYVEGGNHRHELAPPPEPLIKPDVRAEVLHNGLAGTTAWPGSATGRVKVVESFHDVSKVERGDVLVTTMTTPDLILALERAGAIVTDEGGLLCHAAIISRELNVPCLIGCQIATASLADSDLVSVDATPGHGRVVINNGR